MKAEYKQSTAALLNSFVANNVDTSELLVKQERLSQNVEDNVASTMSKTKRRRSAVTKKPSAVKLNEAIKKLKNKQSRKKAVEVTLSQVHSLVSSLCQILHLGWC
mgnify:CR=1 FL=1